ncbi:hypothetical protein OXYTRIMIC_288 [Oxytricha trifallax]|uniref:Uncharacterized protein n=1 Tax=Oxytricha trifallax TaxID=1172189 RepID=A0A073HYP8_9SPIT|nr:hypothetical protein OXYTRIMIC_288 [Oxytricha trifallax]
MPKQESSQDLQKYLQTQASSAQINEKVDKNKAYSKNKSQQDLLVQNQFVGDAQNAQVSSMKKDAQQLISSQKNLNQALQQITKKVTQLNYHIDNLTNRQTTVIPQKLNKAQDVKVEDNLKKSQEISNFIQKEQEKINLMCQRINRYISYFQPILDDKQNDLQIKTDLSINLSFTEIHGLDITQIESLKILNDLLFVTKKIGQNSYDICSMPNSKSQVSRLFTVDTNPNSVVVDENRAIVDNFCFNLQTQKPIQMLLEDIKSCMLIKTGFLLAGRGISAKLCLLKWDGQQYQIQQQVGLFTVSTYATTRLELEKFSNPNNQVIQVFATIFHTNDMLYKITIDTQNFKNVQKVKLGFRFDGFEQIDSEHVAVLFQNQVQIINFNSGEILQQLTLPINNHFVGVPKQFNPTTFQVILSYDSQKQLIKVIDLAKQGFQGERMIGLQIDEIFGQINIIREENEGGNFNEKDMKILAKASKMNQLCLINIDLEF